MEDDSAICGGAPQMFVNFMARNAPDELELVAWRDHTAAAFTAEIFTGGHFFVQTARGELLAALSRALGQVPALP